MEKKYKTEEDPETKLLRITALKDFSDVKKGQQGGLIEKEYNLSQEGDCWVYENAMVYENARVRGNARVYGHAQVYGEAWVSENACVYECAKIFGHAWVSGFAQVYRHAWIYGLARVYDNARIFGNAYVFESAGIFGNAQVYGEASVCGYAKISGDVKLWSSADPNITASIENNKDYVILGSSNIDNIGEFLVFPSNIENITTNISLTATDYIKNLKTIRQLYGEEV